jgi:hypothetical protein
MPRVEHFNRVEGAFSLIATSKCVKHVWQGRIKAQERRYYFRVQRRRQGPSAIATWLFTLCGRSRKSTIIEYQ